MLYTISRNGQTFGPYTPEDVQRYLASGNILPTDLAHSDAAAADAEQGQGWLPVAQIFGVPQPSSGAQLFSGAQQLQPGAFPPAQYNPYLNASPGNVLPQAMADTGWRGEYRYFPVSPLKFCVMSFVTLGLYQVYWSYKQWVRIKAETGENLIPWARALFLGIWNFGLFSRVHDQAVAEEVPAGWNNIVLGVLVLLFSASSRAPGLVGALVFLSFLAYLPVVITIEKINRKHASEVSEQPNDRFSGWNIAGIVLGGLFMMLALIGIVMGSRLDR